jgi:hypothetical protein
LVWSTNTVPRIPPRKVISIPFSYVLATFELTRNPGFKVCSVTRIDSVDYTQVVVISSEHFTSLLDADITTTYTRSPISNLRSGVNLRKPLASSLKPKFKK